MLPLALEMHRLGKAHVCCLVKPADDAGAADVGPEGLHDLDDDVGGVIGFCGVGADGELGQLLERLGERCGRCSRCEVGAGAADVGPVGHLSAGLAHVMRVEAAVVRDQPACVAGGAQRLGQTGRNRNNSRHKM